MGSRIGGSLLADSLEHLERWRRGEQPGPLVIEVGPVYGCNHNCVHCGFQQYEAYGKNRNFLDNQVFKAFLDDFAELGGKQIYFAGNGEPLLNPSLADWIVYGNGLGLSMTMSSNGIPLAGKRITQIIPAIDWIRFSVNGGNAKAYARVHECAEREFEILKRNLSKAASYRDQIDSQARLMMQFVTYDLNWESIPEMVEVHKDLGTDMLIFRNVINKDGSSVKQPEHILDALRAVEHEDRVSVRWDTFFERGGSTVPWTRCSGIYFRTNMDDKGNLVTCNRNLIARSIYGNINTKRFKDIWLSLPRQRMFEMIEAGEDRDTCGKWCQASYDNIFIEEYLRNNDGQSDGQLVEHRAR